MNFKKSTWSQDSVYSIKLTSNLYTLTQMRENNLLQFFALCSKFDNFSEVDLNEIDELFCIFVAVSRIKVIFNRKIDQEVRSVNNRPTPKIMLSTIFGKGQGAGANVIELTEKYSAVGGRIIRKVTNNEGNLMDIFQYELSGMYGNPIEIHNRLLRFFKTGVNWDESKNYVFGSIELPKPGQPGCPRAKML